MTEGDGIRPTRHASIELLQEYMRRRVGGTLIVEGLPTTRLKISPGENRLALLVEMDGEDDPGPDLLTKANLSYGAAYESGKAWHRLEIVLDGNMVEVYPVLCTIADRVQLRGEPFARAVEAVLAGLSEILAGRKGLSLEEQIGLFGELVVLLSLAEQIGGSAAVTAWTGPNHEEHDFGLQQTDLEVKTTLSERRRHWISGLTQLTPTGGTQLRLLSIQVTSAALGGGASLADLVELARELADPAGAQVDRKLETLGWRDWYRDLYTDRWRLRTAPAFYVVDELFPALRLDLMQALMPSPERVTEIHYRIDLDGLPEGTPLFPVGIDIVLDKDNVDEKDSAR